MLNDPRGDSIFTDPESIKVYLQKAELGGNHQASICGSLGSLWVLTIEHVKIQHSALCFRYFTWVCPETTISQHQVKSKAFQGRWVVLQNGFSNLFHQFTEQREQQRQNRRGNVLIFFSFPGSGRSPGGGHGNSLQYSSLENSMDRGAW